MAELLANERAVVLGPVATAAEGTQRAAAGPIDLAVVNGRRFGLRARGQGHPRVVVTAYEVMQSVADNAFATLQRPVAPDCLLGTLYPAAA
jgi:hypothetical protein